MTRIIAIGAFLVIAGLVLLIQPFYTVAVETGDHPCRVKLEPWDLLFELGNLNPGDQIERSVTVTKTGEATANLFLTWDWVDGEPALGEVGSLFEQLIMIIKHGNKELYRGPMSEGPVTGEPPARSDALNVSALIGKPMAFGDVIKLDFIIMLPGLETGNEFMGSKLKTELVFYTICSEIIIPPDPPNVDPPKPPIIVPPEPPKQNPLPPTGGLSVTLLLVGAAMIAAGLVLKRRIVV